jgi:hypothetical protein
MDTQNRAEDPVKRKKGRPRKDANVAIVSEVKPENEAAIDNEGEPIKKKRGRKKKDVVVEEVKPKKKRGRKAAVKYFSSSIRKKIPLTTIVQENNNFILHLDLKDDKQETEREETEILGDNSVIDSVFRSIKNEVEGTEVDGLIEDIESIKLEEEDEVDIRDLYRTRIRSRESQDKLLVQKLEMLHNDDGFINKLINTDPGSQINPNVENKNLIEARVQTENRKKGFFELLFKFVHNTEWLEHTEVHCWWCCHAFDTMPIGMPLDFNTNTRKFRVRGVYCSFACMVAYKNDQKYRNIDSLVKYLYKKLTSTNGGVNLTLPCAPPRCVLQMFGGNLSIEEFRSSTKENKMYKMIEYPMFMSKEYVEEIDILNIKNANVKVFDDTSFNKVVNLDDKRVADAKMRLLQIERNTVTTGNTIDKFINFT